MNPLNKLNGTHSPYHPSVYVCMCVCRYEHEVEENELSTLMQVYWYRLIIDEVYNIHTYIHTRIHIADLLICAGSCNGTRDVQTDTTCV